MILKAMMELAVYNRAMQCLYPFPIGDRALFHLTVLECYDGVGNRLRLVLAVYNRAMQCLHPFPIGDRASFHLTALQSSTQAVDVKEIFHFHLLYHVFRHFLEMEIAVNIVHKITKIYK